jgi:hypothetical protein
MKRFSFIRIVFFLTLFVGCEKEIAVIDSQPKEVRELFKSPEWTKYSCLFDKYGKYGTGIVQYDADSVMQQLFLPYYNADSVKTAMLQVMIMDAGLLPNNDTYFINLIDLTKFDNVCLTGTVDMYGTNFDNFMHDTYLVVDNEIKAEQDYPMPGKYLDEQSKKVGFFACYKAVRDYWDNNAIIKFLCDVDGMACLMAASFNCLMYLAN